MTEEVACPLAGQRDGRQVPEWDEGWGNSFRRHLMWRWHCNKRCYINEEGKVVCFCNEIREKDWGGPSAPSPSFSATHSRVV